MNNKTKKIVGIGLLTAIVAVLQSLAVGIKFGPFSVTFVLIPIVVGAALYGWIAGAWLGFIFGMIVLFTDAGAFLAVSVPGTIVTCLLKGIMAGLVAGLIYNALKKVNNFVAVLVAAISAPIVNTGIFLLGCRLFFYETTKYNPHSPYSAAKASSDHFVRAYHDTYGMPTIVTNCSNNYGPYQFPEKLIPLFINNIRNRKPLPVYGRGENVRDWLFVEDHARAIDLIFHKGTIAQTYNIGGFNEWKNIDIIKVVINTVDRLLGRAEGEDLNLITYVTDRLGHDARYAIDSTKLQKELGWEPSLQFEEGIEKTVKWYLENEAWMDNITSGEYEKYYSEMYANR